MQIIAIVVWHMVSDSVAIGLLESTPVHVDGVLTACVGHQILLTCSHDNDATGTTQWIFGPPVDCSRAIDHNNPFSTDPCGPFMFQNVTELTPDAVFFNSTAIATASASMSGTVVECRDSPGREFNQIGNITLCIIGTWRPHSLKYNLNCCLSLIDTDQPGNLTVTVTNGPQIAWDGSFCVNSATTYRVEVTRADDGKPEGDITITGSTMAIVSNLRSYQEYTVSVTAVCGSCTSDSAVKNFTAQAVATTSKYKIDWQKGMGIRWLHVI